MIFKGYKRDDGRVGIRNHTLIMPVSHYANHVAKMISKKVPESVYFTHQHGSNQSGDDLEQTIRVLKGFSDHPNIFGAVIVANGNEDFSIKQILDHSLLHGKESFLLNIKELGGVNNAISKGIDLAKGILVKSKQVNLELCHVEDIILGTECGGSDALSGITANPVVGECSNLLISNGGTSLLSETMELVGAEHLLAKRAVNSNTREKLLSTVHKIEAGAMKMGVDIRGTQPARGNIEGGISTIEEKSLGCIKKGGSTSLIDVINYAEKPRKKGLILMDTPGHDIEQLTGMVAGGAQIVAFTTGRGTPAGSPIAPVIKIASNDIMYEKMKYNIDLNAGIIASNQLTVDEIGQNLFNLLIETCSGKQTKSEQLKHNEFGIYKVPENM